MIRRRYIWERSIQKTLPDVAELLRGRAPRFVYGGAVRELPIFTFHVVDDSFRRDLERLAQAGYETIGAEELAAYARGDWTPSERAVALTFDDGHRSLEDVAAPLLAEHGMRALAFVVSGHVPDESSERRVGWRELKRLVSLGVLEVGPHSEYHHHVPVAPRIIGYVTPDTDTDFTANVPIPQVSGSRLTRLGEPIFRGRPRYTAERAFRPDPAGIERAAQMVEREGPGFFRRLRWSNELRAAVGSDGEYESPVEAEEAIRSDMLRAARAVAERCPNRAASHLCYPWYARDLRADGLAREAGIEVAYGGITVRPRRSPGVLRRLPPDFIWRLPGPGRISLSELVRRRVRDVRASRRQTTPL
jgi:peptidoglycan/xylan/chitin deacetylase (PgdA/CDA1 family)